MKRLLIEHCAETLAGLKTANLFSYPYSSQEELESEIQEIDQVLRTKKLAIDCLKLGRKRALILVYRQMRLQLDLQQKSTRHLLKTFGYEDFNLSACLGHLKKRLISSPAFPHEIGLFLGYPLEDVMGFIKYNGKYYKAKGYWKIYVHEEQTSQLFKQFTICRNVYLQSYLSGIPLQDLIL